MLDILPFIIHYLPRDSPDIKQEGIIQLPMNALYTLRNIIKMMPGVRGAVGGEGERHSSGICLRGKAREPEPPLPWQFHDAYYMEAYSFLDQDWEWYRKSLTRREEGKSAALTFSEESSSFKLIWLPAVTVPGNCCPWNFTSSQCQMVASFLLIVYCSRELWKGPYMGASTASLFPKGVKSRSIRSVAMEHATF